MKSSAVLLVLFLMVGCQDAQTPPASSGAATQAAGTSDGETDLARQMIEARETATATTVLAAHPDMDRDAAYRIQLEALRRETGGDDGQLVGWKLGGSRVVDASIPPDPSFAYILRSDSLGSGSTVMASDFVDGDIMVEAEIAFVMGADLPGEGHTREAVADAVREVAGAIEIIDIRILPGADGMEPTMNHNIAANLSHAGLILTDIRKPLDAVDLVGESASAFVDGVEKASGAGGQIMGTTPMDALYWIANALPRHGRHLRAGDVIITGSLYDNPTITAGSTAEIRFDSFGAISVSMAE